MKFNAEKKALEKIIVSLRKKSQKYEEKIEYKEYYFEDRSEKWQDSDKGLEHRESISQLEDQMDALEDIIGELEYQSDMLEELTNE